MTDPAPGRAATARRKRPHPAAASRVLVVGAAAAGTLAMTGFMAGPLDTPVPIDAAPVSGTAPAGQLVGAVQPTTAPIARVVVVRRHLPARSAGVASTPTAAVASAPTGSVAARPAPAPAPAPAPRPAPVTSTSSGS